MQYPTVAEDWDSLPVWQQNHVAELADAKKAREQAERRRQAEGKTLRQLRSMVYGPRQFKPTSTNNAAARRRESRTERFGTPPPLPGAPVSSSGSVGHDPRRRTNGRLRVDAPVPDKFGGGRVDTYRLVDGVRVPISTNESRATAAATAARAAARKAAYRANGWAHNGSTVSDEQVDRFVESANHLPDHVLAELPPPGKNNRRGEAIARQHGALCEECGIHHRGECP